MNVYPPPIEYEYVIVAALLLATIALFFILWIASKFNDDGDLSNFYNNGENAE